jgi:hypothetical protein
MLKIDLMRYEMEQDLKLVHGFILKEYNTLNSPHALSIRSKGFMVYLKTLQTGKLYSTPYTYKEFGSDAFRDRMKGYFTKYSFVSSLEYLVSGANIIFIGHVPSLYHTRHTVDK